MMDLSGKTVRFYLSEQGREALTELVPRPESFQALVVSVGDLGPLVWMAAAAPAETPAGTGPVMLVRWDYIETLTFDYEPGGPGSMGFTATQGAQ
jgi:hypothetical protein